MCLLVAVRGRPKHTIWLPLWCVAALVTLTLFIPLSLLCQEVVVLVGRPTFTLLEPCLSHTRALSRSRHPTHTQHHSNSKVSQEGEWVGRWVVLCFVLWFGLKIGLCVSVASPRSWSVSDWRVRVHVSREQLQSTCILHNHKVSQVSMFCQVQLLSSTARSHTLSPPSFILRIEAHSNRNHTLCAVLRVKACNSSPPPPPFPPPFQAKQ